jgi:hypothetical protein
LTSQRLRPAETFSVSHTDGGAPCEETLILTFG